MRKCLRLLRHPLRVLTFREQIQSVARGIDTHLVMNKFEHMRKLESLYLLTSEQVPQKHDVTCNICVYIVK